MDAIEEMNLSSTFNISEVFRIYGANLTFDDSEAAFYMPLYIEVSTRNSFVWKPRPRMRRILYAALLRRKN